jgi:tRNA threonylcarbamoyladenosine modification (KEOPS) complex Cgi121 subunit
LIEQLEGFDHYLAVAGFKNVKITDIDKFFADVKAKTGDACVQFFNADLIAGQAHLCFAALNALTAFKNKVNISNSLAMETLLYASAKRQIKDALKLMGVSSNSKRVAVLVLTETQNQASSILESVSTLLQGRRDDAVVEFSKEKIDGLMKLFGISTLELGAKTEKKGAEKEALLDLVIEHMALLVTQR